MALTIETRALATGYPGHPVGRDMNLTVRGGRVTALLGPNGCGKTTLFRTLLGLLKPRGGQVLIDGDDLAGLPRSEVAKRVAYVPQVVEGYFPFSVMDVVLMGRAPHLGTFAAPGARDRRVAGEALAELRIADLAGRSFTAISSGQRQLVLIARALAQQSPVIFMDEPTASLDFANQFHVLDCICRLSHAGRTIVISSHHPDHALRFADDAVLMETGGVFAAGTTGDILSSETLSRVYGMEIVIAEVAAGRGGTAYRVCVPNPEGGPAPP